MQRRKSCRFKKTKHATAIKLVLKNIDFDLLLFILLSSYLIDAFINSIAANCSRSSLGWPVRRAKLARPWPPPKLPEPWQKQKRREDLDKRITERIESFKKKRSKASF